jgi:pyruvate dehydrogenase E2 component (dihydrolipoamide acetyltransferase)
MVITCYRSRHPHYAQTDPMENPDINTPTLAAPGAPAPDASPGSDFRDEKHTMIRKTIARRLAESKSTAPHFYLTVDIRMDAMARARAAYNNANSEHRVSVNDIVVKAVSVALAEHPAINASWMEDRVRYHTKLNIGVAMAVPGGLVVPVVKDAGSKSLAEVAADIRAFGVKATARKLVPFDWEGNTFTVSNLGMFGIESFTAIINAPDSCILALGAVRDAAVVDNGQVVAGKMMKITLCSDHRVVDGAAGAAFLVTLKKLLEVDTLPG